MRLYRSTQHAELISPLSSVHPERAQAGAFLPKLLEHAGLLKEDTGEDAEESAKTIVGQSAEKAEENRKQAVMQRYMKTDEAISELNAILVYKKVVQGLIYSPPDCDKYLALDAKPQGLSSVGPDLLAPTLAPTLAAPSGIDTVPKGVCGFIRGHTRLGLWHSGNSASKALPCCLPAVHLHAGLNPH